jgi:hypothetical protein
MKKIIIYTSDDEIISFRIVKTIIENPKFKNFKFDIILTKPSFIRKLKVLIILSFSGSLPYLIKLYRNRTNKILLKNKKIKFILRPKKNYDFGLSINYLKNIKLQKYDIYNFHLGNLINQRGSFIFFYKLLYNWKSIALTCHLITKQFDVGYIVKQKNINVSKEYLPIEIIDLYNLNKNFVIECIIQILKNKKNFIKQGNYKKINYVPSFLKVFLNLKYIIFR